MLTDKQVLINKKVWFYGWRGLQILLKKIAGTDKKDFCEVLNIVNKLIRAA